MDTQKQNQIDQIFVKYFDYPELFKYETIYHLFLIFVYTDSIYKTYILNKIEEYNLYCLSENKYIYFDIKVCDVFRKIDEQFFTKNQIELIDIFSSDEYLTIYQQISSDIYYVLEYILNKFEKEEFQLLFLNKLLEKEGLFQSKTKILILKLKNKIELSIECYQKKDCFKINPEPNDINFCNINVSKSICEPVYDMVIDESVSKNIIDSNFEYITGLESITKIQIEDKTIYLFGEKHLAYEHINHPDYIDVRDFLLNITKIRKYNFDIYFESTYLSKMFNNEHQIEQLKDIHVNSALKSMEKILYNCLDYKKCKFIDNNNVRLHFVDIRKIEDLSLYQRIFMYIVSLISQNKIHETNQNSIDFIIFYHEFQRYKDISELLNHIINESKIKKYITKEYTYIPNDYINNLLMCIHIYFLTKIDQFRNLFISNFQNVNTSFEKLNMCLLYFITYINELYTISRMFRDFENKGRSNFPQKNIIYLSGDIHSEIIRDCFLSIVNIEILKSKIKNPEYLILLNSIDQESLQFLKNINVLFESHYKTVEDKCTFVSLNKFKPFFI